MSAKQASPAPYKQALTDLLEKFQLGNLTKGDVVDHFSTASQKKLKTNNFIFSLKVAEMHSGVFS